ncbi:MAG: type II toxin-antitoxin system HicA family toxin [Syntrophales bacterium]
MLDLPIISGKEAIKIFGCLGFKIVRQKGSHAVLRKENKGCVIPIHKELAVGTLRSAIKQAGITIEEFIDAYKNR